MIPPGREIIAKRRQGPDATLGATEYRCQTLINELGLIAEFYIEKRPKDNIDCVAADHARHVVHLDKGQLGKITTNEQRAGHPARSKSAPAGPAEPAEPAGPAEPVETGSPSPS